MSIHIPSRWASAPGALGVLAVLLLLLVFQQVVQGAVTQGALRRADVAQRHAATWRCKILSERRRIDACLAQIQAALPPPAPPLTTALAGTGR